MDKENTVLSRRFDKNGIELSGGQNQKLAISRAMFKDAPIVILDEPTSALDPMAEYEVYEQLVHMMENKISIFVSHRMAFCKICNRIIIIEAGKICGDGAHEELLVNNDKYRTMWETQAQFYR